MNYHDAPHLSLKEESPSATVSWRSPSNIALIKYWGKQGRQFPRNPSLSFTLENAFSETSITYQPKSTDSNDLEIRFELNGEKNDAFEKRIAKYLSGIKDAFPFLSQMSMDIKSSNSFPHSVGIASSASGMSALALCICSIEHQLFGTLADDDLFRQKASYMARLGSGSACRSIFPKLSLWGQTGLVSGASNEYAIPILDGIDPVFEKYADAILIVHADAKSVSSTAGHQLMEQHPFAQIRYEEARRNLHRLLETMRRGELDDFGKICELEAMQLHALMMCSNPSYILMKPNTLKVLDLIREFRLTTQHPVYFTLDAGPNIHLLYPRSCSAEVENFINDVLVTYCERGSWIADCVGQGPIQL